MRSTLVALLRSTHPEPAVAVVVVTVLLGAGAGLDPWRLLVLGIAVALHQASVGLSNDWLDASRDRRAGRTDKPVARGDVSVGTVRLLALGTGFLTLPATLPLGVGATIAHAVWLGAGWGYNLGLKTTPLSLAAYLAGFGALPVLVTLARAEPAWPTWWAIAAGASLGAAAHFTNVLPDLDADVRTGVRGLPHRFGRAGSTVAAWTALAIAALCLAVGLDGAASGLVAVAATAVLAVVGIGLAARGRTRWPFRLIILAALVDVAVLVAAGSAIVSP